MERESGSLFHCCMYSRWGLKLAQAQVIGDGPLAQIVFSPQEVLDYREQKRTEDATMRRAMMLGLFQRGIFLNPVHLIVVVVIVVGGGGAVKARVQSNVTQIVCLFLTFRLAPSSTCRCGTLKLTWMPSTRD